MNLFSIINSSSFKAGGSYVYSNGINLLFQLCILWKFGESYYQEIGFVYLLLMSVTFLGDLGYSQYFLRESTGSPTFITNWRISLSHKIAATIVFGSTLLIYIAWQRGIYSNSFLYLVCAFPGLIFLCLTPTTVLFSRSQTSLAIKVLPIQQTLIAIPSTVLLFLGFDSGVLSILLGLVFSLGYLGGLIFVLRIIDNRKYGLPSLNIFALGNLKESIYLWQLGLSGSLYDRAVLIFVEHLRPEFLAVYIILNQILQGISGVLVQIQKVLIPKIRSYFEDANTNKINKILTLHTTFYLVAMTILLSFGINIGNVFPEIYSLEIALYASLILSEWLCRALTTTCISALLVYRLEKYIRNMLVSIQVIFGVVQMMMAYFLTSLVAILLLRVIVGGVIIILFYKRLKIFALSLLSIVLVIWIPLAVYVSQSGIGQDSTTTLTFITLLLLVLIGSVAIAQVKQKRACEGASQE